MYGKAIPAEQLVQAGNYRVALASVGNPDFCQDPTRSLPGVRRKTVRAGSLGEAAQLCRAYIEQHELGAGNWSGGDVTEDGKLVARVSFNGRVWEPA